MSLAKFLSGVKSNSKSLSQPDPNPVVYDAEFQVGMAAFRSRYAKKYCKIRDDHKMLKEDLLEKNVQKYRALGINHNEVRNPFHHRFGKGTGKYNKQKQSKKEIKKQKRKIKDAWENGQHSDGEDNNMRRHRKRGEDGKRSRHGSRESDKSRRRRRRHDGNDDDRRKSRKRRRSRDRRKRRKRRKSGERSSRKRDKSEEPSSSECSGGQISEAAVLGGEVVREKAESSNPEITYPTNDKQIESGGHVNGAETKELCPGGGVPIKTAVSVQEPKTMYLPIGQDHNLPVGDGSDLPVGCDPFWDPTN